MPALSLVATRRAYRAAWHDGRVHGSRHLPAPLGLVIFDNDGVLVDSERLSSATVARVLSELGVPTTPADAHRDFTGGTLDRIRQIVEGSGHHLPATFEATYAERLAGVFERELAPSAGVPGLLEELDRHGIGYCVASNGTRGRIRASLRAAGLLDRFAGRTFSADDVPRPKPAPDLFLRAADSLGVPAGACLVVEDTPPGIAAGRAAGMRVWTPAGTYPAEALRDADRVFESMELLAAELAAELRRRDEAAPQPRRGPSTIS